MSTSGKFVLFDFDGVIADSNALSFELSQKFNPQLDTNGYRDLYDDNLFKALKALSTWNDSHPKEYTDLYESRVVDEVGLFRGMDEVIASVAGEYTLAVISSTGGGVITSFLNAQRLRMYFADVLGNEIHHSKSEKMSMLFDQYGISASHCVFITDTLGDMREANAHTMGTIGVSWGVHPRQRLEQGMPFRIVDSPAELPDAIDDYFARPL